MLARTSVKTQLGAVHFTWDTTFWASAGFAEAGGGAKVSGTRSPVANTAGGGAAAPPGERGVTRVSARGRAKTNPGVCMSVRRSERISRSGPREEELVGLCLSLFFPCFLLVPTQPDRPARGLACGRPIRPILSPVCVRASLAALQPQRLGCLDRKALSQLPTITSRP